MREWSLFDNSLDIAVGIEWRSWGLGPMATFHRDLTTFYVKLGPLFFSIIHWRHLDNDSIYQR